MVCLIILTSCQAEPRRSKDDDEGINQLRTFFYDENNEDDYNEDVVINVDETDTAEIRDDEVLEESDEAVPDDLPLYGNRNENLINGGIAVYDSIHDKYFFAGAGSYRGIYVFDEVTSTTEKLCEDEAQYLNLVGDRLYYVNESDGYKVYSMKVDGTDRSLFIDHDSDWLTYYDEYFYYRNNNDNGYLYKKALDGSIDELKYDRRVSNINVNESYVSFINEQDGYDVYTMGHDSYSASRISTDGDMSVLISTENYLYYGSGALQKSYSLNSFEEELMINKLSTSGGGQNIYNNSSTWTSHTVNSGIRYCANDSGLYALEDYPDHGGYLGPMVELFSVYPGPVNHLQCFPGDYFIFQDNTGQVKMLQRNQDTFRILDYQLNDFDSLQQADNKIYFIEDYDTLYSFDLINNSLEIVVSDLAQSVFLLTEDSLYYVAQGSGGYDSLFSIQLGSARAEELFQIGDHVKGLHYYSGKIYYVNYDGLGSYDLSTGNTSMYAFDFSTYDIAFDRNFLVFNVDFNSEIYIMTIDSHVFEYLFAEGDFVVADGKVYAYDYGSYGRTNYNVDCYDFEDYQVRYGIVSTGDIVDVLYAEGDWIYYDKLYNGQTYRYNVETGEDEHIGNFIGEIICIYDDQVFYMEQGYTGLHKRNLSQCTEISLID